MKNTHYSTALHRKYNCLLGSLRLICVLVSGVLPLICIGSDTTRVTVDYGQFISELPLSGGNMTYLDGSNRFMDANLELRQDKIDGAFAAGVKMVRFPGGTIVNTYRWKDAVGPYSQRVDQAHGFNTSGGSIPSDWGPDEAAQYAESVGAELMMVINFNETLANVSDLVEYMNSPVGQNPNGGVDWAAVRAENGHPEPYNVRYWEIGNESAGSVLKCWPNWPAVGDDNENDGLLQNTQEAINWWAFGGYRSYTHQKAVRRSDWGDTGSNPADDEILKSNNEAGETYYVKFPRLNMINEVRVGETLANSSVWTEVPDLSNAGSSSEVFESRPWDGRILFGDGINGKKLPLDYYVFVSYETGWRPGYVHFYKQMKLVDPSIKIVNSHYNSLSVYSDILAAGADINGYQVHTADEGFAKPPAGADFQDQLLGCAYFGMPKLLQYDVNALTSAGLPTGTEMVHSEYGFGSSWDSSLNLSFARTIIGALAEGLTSERLANLHGPSSAFPVRVSLVNYMDSGGGSPMDHNGIVTGAGLTKDLISNVFGKHVINSQPTVNPLRSLVWQGLNWQNSPQVESIPKAVTMASRDDAGNLYVMAVNTTSSEEISIIIDVENGFSLKGKPLTSWTVESNSSLSTNTISNPNEIYTEETSDPIDVVFWDEDTINFPLAAQTLRIIKIDNYSGNFVLESMDHPNWWIEPTSGQVNAAIVLDQAGSGSDTVWEIEPDGQGYYRILATDYLGKPLMPSGTQVGASLKLGDSVWAGDWTKWTLKHIGGNVYRPLNKATGLPFKPSSVQSGSTIVNTEANDYSNDPRWRMVWVE